MERASDHNAYVEQVRHAADLVELGRHDEAIAIFMELLESDVSDIDKAMMCLNLATVYDKLSETDAALDWYARGVAYEAGHGASFVAEQRAVFLAEKGRDRESVTCYEELLGRPALPEETEARIRANIEILRRRIDR